MIIYGKQLFLHLLKNHKDEFLKIFLAKECDKALFREISKLNIKIEKLDFKKAQALARGGNHQGFLAEVKDYKFSEFKDLKSKNFLAVLYNLSDVGNIGAIVRSAYALGVDGVIIVTKSLAIEGIIRSSSGAAYEIPICKFEDGLTLLNELKQVGFKIYASDAKGKNLKEFASKKVLVMGSEGEGIPNKAIQKCDELIGIEMRNNWDSLNVNAAFAIFCDRMTNGQQ